MHSIVAQCAAAGLVSGKHLAVDGTKVRANTSVKILEPLVVEVEMDKYLGRLNLKRDDSPHTSAGKHPNDKNFRGTKHSNSMHRSTSDPDARLYRKSLGQETSLLKNIHALTADTGYGTTKVITELFDRGNTPHIPLLADLEH